MNLIDYNIQLYEHYLPLDIFCEPKFDEYFYLKSKIYRFNGRPLMNDYKLQKFIV